MTRFSWEFGFRQAQCLAGLHLDWFLFWLLKTMQSGELIDRIRSAIIGGSHKIETPFGTKPLVYADYTASGRSLSFIEDFIQTQVLPYYANTHTESSFTGAQTTALREASRQQIRHAVNGSDDDKVIFCGSGATSAINKLIDMLNLRLPRDLSERYQLDQMIPDSERPVVFVGPYEHHSNELPWRESIATVVTVPLTAEGLFDIDALEDLLQKFKARPFKIGSFSAASNVTGIMTPVDAVASLLHRHDALSFWDYAAAAPYVTIDMQGDGSHSYKDAIFISPHKFIGGPGTPGILVVNKAAVNNSVPAMPGGGTVTYVTPSEHSYSKDIERREEGGTPAIVESIRAGLVFKLQQDVGLKAIAARESELVRKVMARLGRHDNIEILGNLACRRLSIFSLRFKHQGKDLHYGFVVALLNDLFGIQSRGGCSCAGPYGHSLLDLDVDYSRSLEEQINDGNNLLRPGWLRLNFNYFISDAEFEYLLAALELVASYGVNLLPFYQCDIKSGLWSYQGKVRELPSSLLKMNYEIETASALMPEVDENVDYEALLVLAKKCLTEADESKTKFPVDINSEQESLRWFVLAEAS